MNMYMIPDFKVKFISLDSEIKAVVCQLTLDRNFVGVVSTFHDLSDAVKFSQKNRFVYDRCLQACTVYKYVCDTKGDVL
jgi:hypothetical protein